MSLQRVGYVRVEGLNPESRNQLDGIHLDQVFTDIDTSLDADATGPGLELLLTSVHRGDTVFVQSMDRLARSLGSLSANVRTLTLCGVRIEFVTERVVFDRDDAQATDMMLGVMTAFEAFQGAVMGERRRAGIALAKDRGRTGGRKKSPSGARIVELRNRVETGEPKAALAREFGISRGTLYTFGSPRALLSCRVILVGLSAQVGDRQAM